MMVDLDNVIGLGYDSSFGVVNCCCIKEKRLSYLTGSFMICNKVEIKKDLR